MTLSQARGLFVTGTDTGVGKTVITAALAAALRAEGRNIGVWKPVQSGALLGSGITDAERLLQGSGINELPESVAPYTFEAPLTPLLAARAAHVELTLEALSASGLPLMARYDSLLIEGAGGIAVPLTNEALVIDWIAELGTPVLIVARSSLGTINHTLLTAAMLKQRGIPVVGVVLNDGFEEAIHDAEDPSTSTNAALIEQFGDGLRVLGRFPRIVEERPSPAKLADLIGRTIDLSPVRQALE
ncbi:ATP-dependent dethiobiotin synthetase BioD [Paenibacillus plantiphilus]|uniref:ATP-dependent dethiobiotin synthetase BioD n=1 Tax=Paenibacillus plantiphilus TaxID=2905650 RepID=A0ABN8G1J8_9BACL|nr:dethiobiotin synthase [Paenibacillus plantiphilus]CAH1193648.1 ATP-dependent dethiobiotin synthetase BioD [Paenibacillus plantiphilus]